MATRASEELGVFGAVNLMVQVAAPRLIQVLKRFEFNLRRQAELKGNEVFLSGADDVPEEFRKLVEQYYKSLSKAPDKKSPETKSPDIRK